MPEITVPGEPVAKQRPRRGKNGQWYTPRQTVEYEELVGWTWRQARHKPLSGPIALRVVFYLGGRDKDLDNLVKCVLDGLNGVAWEDDRQVLDLEAKMRRVSAATPAASAFIRVEQLA